MRQFGDIYRNRKVVVTGHTGFKGSWLSLWLTELGAALYGFALPPETNPNHWDLLHLGIPGDSQDIRDYAAVAAYLKQTQPEIVFHLAAQPLVRRSYRDPLETWSTNVIGTANLLEACRQTPSVRAVVVITTDKVYENREWSWGYREIDRLGGHDPYSASKAATELVVASYQKAFFSDASAPLLATARAGNVIGGGDWSEDRLVPDLFRAMQNNTTVEIRSPGATRPWQHVLECLSGYLLLGQKLLEENPEYAEAWNFGPEVASNQPVANVLVQLQTYWPELRWRVTEQLHPHEAHLLYLDSSKAKKRLNWQPVWSLEASLTATACWYSSYLLEKLSISRRQLSDFVSAAADAKLCWITA